MVFGKETPHEAHTEVRGRGEMTRHKPGLDCVVVHTQPADRTLVSAAHQVLLKFKLLSDPLSRVDLGVYFTRLNGGHARTVR